MESTRTQRIARKPLPSTARVPHLQDAPPDATSAPLPDANVQTDQSKYPPLNSSLHDKENVPLEGEAAGAADPFRDGAHSVAQPPPAKVSTNNTHGSVLRKPLGPRPLSIGPPSPSGESHPHEPSQPAGVVKPATPPTPDEARPNLPPRPAPGPLRLDHLPAQTFDDIHETRSPIRSPVRSPGFQSPYAQSRSPSPQSNKKPFTPFSLSIIRRDPVTGHQWNIGKVSSFQSTIVVPQDPQNPDSPKIAQYPKGYPAINVHIETSGYARFRNFPTALPKMSDFPRMSLDSARPGSSGTSATTRNMKELAASLQAQVEQQKGHDDTEEGFRRQVTMTYTKTWTSNLKEAFSGKRRERSSTNTSATDSNYNEPLDPPRAGFHRRQDSGNSTNSNDSMFGSLVPNPANNDNATHPPQQHHQQHHHHYPHRHHQHHGSDASATSAAAAVNTTATTPGKPDEPVIATRPGAGLRPKGYTFASPWDGRCDFRTSSNGRALKCHHIRNTTSQGFNPLVAAQALRDAMPESNGSGGGGGGGGRTRARGMSASLPMGDMSNRVPVSELRFNLPSSDLFNSKEDRDRAVAEMKEGLGRLLVRSPGGHEYDDGAADDDDKEEPIFDFSGLGREKAGGGNRGRRAKLGKLLVHDEGLKMLDLVVAANMGIWWQAWERSF